MVKPMDSQQEYVLRTVEERDIRIVRLWFSDILGTLKSVAIAPKGNPTTAATFTSLSLT